MILSRESLSSFTEPLIFSCSASGFASDVVAFFNSLICAKESFVDSCRSLNSFAALSCAAVRVVTFFRSSIRSLNLLLDSCAAVISFSRALIAVLIVDTTLSLATLRATLSLFFSRQSSSAFFALSRFFFASSTLAELLNFASASFETLRAFSLSFSAFSKRAVAAVISPSSSSRYAFAASAVAGISASRS